MKKLFIFVSSLVMTSMISADNGRGVPGWGTVSTIEIAPVFMRLDTIHGGYTMPHSGEPFQLPVNLQIDTVQSLINAINKEVKPDGYAISKLFFPGGEDNFSKPGLRLEDTSLRSGLAVAAIFEKSN